MYADLPGPCRELLDLQHGVIARWQATSAGLPPHVVDTRLRQGRWQSLYRGSYAAFTGPPPRLSVLWAAVLRGGPDAAQPPDRGGDRRAHRPARPDGSRFGSAGPSLAVSARERHPAAPPLKAHRAPRLAAARHPQRTPPRTRVEETAVDLAQLAADLDEALSWLTAACGRRLTTPVLLRQALGAHTRMPWRYELTAALTDVKDGVQSPLEFRYVRDVERAHGLPKADRQVLRLCGQRPQYLDNLYRQYRLAVELDGQVAHPVAGRWSDIRRDNVSTVSGIVTLRYGWVDVTDRPCSAAAEIAAVLRSRGWASPPIPCRRCAALPLWGDFFRDNP